MTDILKQIKLKNFQRHEDTTVELTPGVNILTGPSDKGKSAVIRSINWILRNRPLGISDIRHDPVMIGENKKLRKNDLTSVELQFEDGSVIRERDEKGINCYKVVNGDTINEFRAFRDEVPEDVLTKCDVLDCCVQMQDDRYFLLQDTPGEVARKLNEFSGLDIIDEVQFNVNKIVKDTKTDLERSKSEIESITTDIEDLKFLDEVGVFVDRIRRGLKSVDSFGDKINALGRLMSMSKKLNKDIDEFYVWLEVKNLYKELIVVVDEYEKLELQIENLSYLLTQIQKLNLEISDCSKLLGVKNVVMDLESDIVNFLSFSKSIKYLGDLIGESIDIVVAVDNYNIEIDELKEDYIEKLKEIGICPTCGTDINDVTLECC